MKSSREKLNILLIILAIILGGVAVWLFRLPPQILSDHNTKDDPEDSIRLQSKEVPDFNDTILSDIKAATNHSEQILEERNVSIGFSTESHTSQNNQPPVKKTIPIRDTDLNTMISNHPFGNEVKKVLSGELEENDSVNRRIILNYCEHLRTAYTGKDIDFLRQVYSDEALIITGHIIKSEGRGKIPCSDRVSYTLHTKRSYIDRLEKIFNSNGKINVTFSEFKILRHPTVKGIYGVKLRQKYKNDKYSDDGYLFLLWDFRNPTLPLIHVRTWQPKVDISNEEDLIDLGDFNLE